MSYKPKVCIGAAIVCKAMKPSRSRRRRWEARNIIIMLIHYLPNGQQCSTLWLYEALIRRLLCVSHHEDSEEKEQKERKVGRWSWSLSSVTGVCWVSWRQYRCSLVRNTLNFWIKRLLFVIWSLCRQWYQRRKYVNESERNKTDMQSEKRENEWKIENEEKVKTERREIRRQEKGITRRGRI